MSQVNIDWLDTNLMVIFNVLFMLSKGFMWLDLNPNNIQANFYLLAVVYVDEWSTGTVQPDPYISNSSVKILSWSLHFQVCVS